MKKIFISFSNFYKETLKSTVNKTKTVGSFIIFIIIASVLLFSFLKKELLPKKIVEHINYWFTDEGTSFEYTQEQAQKVEALHSGVNRISCVELNKKIGEPESKSIDFLSKTLGILATYRLRYLSEFRWVEL